MTIREQSKLEELENCLESLESALIEVKYNDTLLDIRSTIEEAINQVQEELEPLQELENSEWARDEDYMNSEYERGVILI